MERMGGNEQKGRIKGREKREEYIYRDTVTERLKDVVK